MTEQYELIKNTNDVDCGCIEQVWNTPVGYLAVHILPNGLCECFFDDGDSEWEVEIKMENKNDFISKLQDYVKSKD